MSAASIFVGDELSAAGFRLCGVETRVPAPGNEEGYLHEAMTEARVVLLGSRCAKAVSPAALEVALAQLSPLVMLVPDWDGTLPPGDPANKVRQVLGLEP